MRSVLGIRVLTVLDGAGSFSDAARQLGMTQSAVSQHLGVLERQVGLELVRRGSRPVELTRAGLVLAEHGAAVMARLDAATRDLHELAERHHRRLQLGGFPTALATFVPRAIRLVSRRLPNLSLDVVDDHSQGLLPHIVQRTLDVAVLFDDAAAPRLPGLADEVETTVLMADRYVVLLPERHRLATAPADPQLTDLAEENWIGGTSRSAWFAIVRASCRASGVEPRVALTSDDYLAVQSLVAAHLGIAVVPGLVAVHRIPHVVVRQLRGPAPVRTIVAARPRSTYPSEASDAMVAALVEVTSAEGLGRGAR